MDSALLRDLAVVIVVAAGTTLLCRALRQPVVIGYLLAGLIIGPYTPPFTLVHDMHSISTMAELGLAILMFALGLEFHLPKLQKVGARATLATILEIFGMLGVGYGVGRWLGWSPNDSIYLGAILSISSTTIIIKVLSDLKMVGEEFAQAVFGILILEDIAAVVILTVLSGLGIHQGNQSLTALRALVQVSFFVVLFLIFGLVVIPRLLRFVAKFRSSEMTGLTALGLCLASALLAEHLGFSIALGAFLIGAVIGVSSEAEGIERWIHPIRDLFSAIFFVSAGLLINPGLLWSMKGPVALIALITVIGKMFTGAAGSFLAGYPVKTSFRIGMTLAQIGEFSFVFASLGLKTGLASDFLYPVAVAVSALTTLLTPYLIRTSDSTVAAVMGRAPARLVKALDRYEEARQNRKGIQGSQVLARYIGRLCIYIALLSAGFLLTHHIAAYVFRHESPSPWLSLAIWIVSWTLQLPLVHAAAGYINHFLLLTLTELSSQSRVSSALFQKIPIQRAYDLAEGVIWALLAVIWAMQPDVRGSGIFVGTIVVMAAAALLLRGALRPIYGRLEQLLDEIFGLATSEPLRRAAITIQGPESVLNESIRRIRLGKQDPAVRKSLRELRVREQTGASVIAIYREGALNANPSAETVLLPDDILVVLGNAEECQRAEKLLSIGIVLKR